MNIYLNLCIAIIAILVIVAFGLGIKTIKIYPKDKKWIVGTVIALIAIAIAILLALLPYLSKIGVHRPTDGTEETYITETMINTEPTTEENTINSKSHVYETETEDDNSNKETQNDDFTTITHTDTMEDDFYKSTEPIYYKLKTTYNNLYSFDCWINDSNQSYTIEIIDETNESVLSYEVPSDGKSFSKELEKNSIYYILISPDEGTPKFKIDVYYPTNDSYD